MHLKKETSRWGTVVKYQIKIAVLLDICKGTNDL